MEEIKEPVEETEQEEKTEKKMEEIKFTVREMRIISPALKGYFKRDEKKFEMTYDENMSSYELIQNLLKATKFLRYARSRLDVNALPESMRDSHFEPITLLQVKIRVILNSIEEKLSKDKILEMMYNYSKRDFNFPNFKKRLDKFVTDNYNEIAMVIYRANDIKPLPPRKEIDYEEWAGGPPEAIDRGEEEAAEETGEIILE